MNKVDQLFPVSSLSLIKIVPGTKKAFQKKYRLHIFNLQQIISSLDRIGTERKVKVAN